MTNTTQIRAYIESQGLKLGHVARVLGISSSALHQKLNDESDSRPPAMNTSIEPRSTRIRSDSRSPEKGAPR